MCEFQQGFLTDALVAGKDNACRICRMYARGRSVPVFAGVRLYRFARRGPASGDSGPVYRVPRMRSMLVNAWCAICACTVLFDRWRVLASWAKIVCAESVACTHEIGRCRCTRAYVCTGSLDGFPRQATRDRCTVSLACYRRFDMRGGRFVRVQCSSTGAHIQEIRGSRCIVIQNR